MTPTDTVRFRRANLERLKRKRGQLKTIKGELLDPKNIFQVQQLGRQWPALFDAIVGTMDTSEQKQMLEIARARP